tara:strand:+ start:1534 stop:1851 length:318 start_codon:yes stop_codon:yes gene_type:complete
MKPIKPFYINNKRPYKHKRRKQRKHLTISKKHNELFKRVLIQLKWKNRVKLYRLVSKKKKTLFIFKQYMLKANYNIVLLTKHNIETKELSTFMKPSKNNPYKTKH